MKEPDKCVFEYCGYKAPETPDELEMEILGLKNLIKSAEVRISSLTQSKFYAEAVMRSRVSVKRNNGEPDGGGLND